MDRAVGAERHGLVQGAHGAFRAHRHGDDLLDCNRAALLDLHRRLDGVRVIRVEVLLPAAVHAPCRGIDFLLDGGVRNLLHQHAYLHSSATPSGSVDLMSEKRGAWLATLKAYPFW